ncbi:MAG TPA: GreA/GreB family elongation factor [Kiritimatiellia bacterium]|nr:GreA/GreB family elongation factor [Kiritimatiellia bacterium]
MDTNTIPDESSFLAALSSDAPPIPALLAYLEADYGKGDVAASDERADVLIKGLQEKGAIGDALKALAIRAEKGRALDSKAALEKAQGLLGSDWEAKALFEEAGLNGAQTPAKALRRLATLKALVPGTLCYDKTWGIGVIGTMDFFYKRVDVKFTRKPNHQLSLAYAGETLQLLESGHIYSVAHQQRGEMDRLIKEEPIAVIKKAIVCFGPVNALQLQEKLVPDVMNEATWKKFWDAARKAMKKDPSVLVPSNRKDPIQILDAGESGEDHLFDQFAKERNLEELVRQLEKFVEEKSASGPTDAQKAILQDRLSFLVKGAWPRQPGLMIRGRLAGLSLGLDDATYPELDISTRLIKPEMMLKVLVQTPVRSTQPLLEYLAVNHAGELHAMLLDLLPRLDVSSLNEAIAYLSRAVGEDKIAARFRAEFDTRNPGVEMVSWVARNMDKIESWNLGPIHLALQFMLDQLDQEYSGDQLKARNLLRERFEKPEWMEALLARLDHKQRVNLISRVRISGGWSHLDRQSLLAMIVKRAPELEAVLAERAAEAAGDQKPSRGPVTSIRSYEERKSQLQKIVEIEIPRVAKEIGAARELGDLRENFEFKAAKDAQALLYKRRDEITAQLSMVTPTEFVDATTETAGPGNTVVVRYQDGRSETYHLLGEWDGDPERGILSSNSKMFKALAGHKQGDQLAVPTEVGEAACTMESISLLSDEMKRWVRGE